MSAPENTTKRDALDHFAGMLGGTDRYITDMEAAGQRQVVNSTVLPYAYDRDDAPFEALGFTFGEQVPGDNLFRQATLPEGWTREGTEHAMHSVIKDERGIARVGIFYKAAFYDRRADMSIQNVGGRVATSWIYGDETNPTLNPALTADELEAARRSASQYLKDAEDYPSREDRVSRAQALFKAATIALARLKGGES